jgi:hypothetical protein
MSSNDINIECQKLFDVYSNIKEYEERVIYINDIINPFLISIWKDLSNINFEKVNKEGIYNYLFDMVSSKINNKISVNHMAIAILESLEQSEENTAVLNRVHYHDEQPIVLKFAYRYMFSPMVIRLLIQKHKVDVTTSGKIYVSSNKNINQNVFQTLLTHILRQQEICNKKPGKTSSFIYKTYCGKLGTCFHYSDNLEYALTEHKDEKGMTFIDMLLASKQLLESTKETRELINSMKANKVLKPYIKNWV